MGLKLVDLFARILYAFDRMIDWVYENLSLSIAFGVSRQLRSWHNGNYTVYIAWSLTGAFLVIMFLMTRG
jgi:hypothetical protein